MTEFDKFCFEKCDCLYDPRLPIDSQSTGYIMLRKMVDEDITPYSMEEIESWEKNPTIEELFSVPNIKYMRFLHANLRPHIIENWEYIKKLKTK